MKVKVEGLTMLCMLMLVEMGGAWIPKDILMKSMTRKGGFQVGGRHQVVMMGTKKKVKGITPREMMAERLKSISDPQKVYVGNIEHGVTEDRLEKLFSRVGRVAQAKIIKDAEKKPKGYGFVTFVDPQEATNAILYLNGSSLDGRKIVVDNVDVQTTPAEQEESREAKRIRRSEKWKAYKAERDAVIGDLFEEPLTAVEPLPEMPQAAAVAAEEEVAEDVETSDDTVAEASEEVMEQEDQGEESITEEDTQGVDETAQADETESQETVAAETEEGENVDVPAPEETNVESATEEESSS